MILLQDCIEGMKELEEGSIDAIVTSPPYNLNIKYGKYADNKPKQDYLDWIRLVFKEGKRILKDDGHLFVNMGYSNIDPYVGMEVAMTLRYDWVLQNNINWVKSIHVNDKTSGHFKPINSKRFLCPTWENLFHFTKDGNVNVDRLSVGVKYEYYEANIRGNNTKENKPNLRDKGNAWFIPYETINSKELKGKHPAVFPVKFTYFKLPLLILPALVEASVEVPNCAKGFKVQKVPLLAIFNSQMLDYLALGGQCRDYSQSNHYYY